MFKHKKKRKSKKEKNEYNFCVTQCLLISTKKKEKIRPYQHHTKQLLKGEEANQHQSTSPLLLRKQYQTHTLKKKL